MLTPEQLAKLINLTLRNEQSIDVILSVIGDLGRMIVSPPQRCTLTGCTRIATVVNDDCNYSCDHHAAVHIVMASSDESQWNDMPDAASIRRLQEYIDVLRNRDVEAPSLH